MATLLPDLTVATSDDAGEEDQLNAVGRISGGKSHSGSYDVMDDVTVTSQGEDSEGVLRDSERERVLKERERVDEVQERNLYILCQNLSPDVRWQTVERPKDERSIGFLKDWFSVWSFLNSKFQLQVVRRWTKTGADWI